VRGASSSAAHVASFVEELVALPKVLETLQNERDATREFVANETRARTKAELTQELERLASAQRELADLTSARNQLQNEIAEIEQRQQALCDDLDRSIQARIDAAVSSPASLLSDVAMLRPFLQSGGSHPSGPNHLQLKFAPSCDIVEEAHVFSQSRTLPHCSDSPYGQRNLVPHDAATSVNELDRNGDCGR
jgi:hypothetical protein